MLRKVESSSSARLLGSGPGTQGDLCVESVTRLSLLGEPQKSRVASEIMERRLTGENPGFVSIVTMVETVWVLDRAYKMSAQEIAAAVERVLQTDVLVVEHEQEVFGAMIALKEGQGSFADVIIAALGAKAGCSFTVTLDKKALRLPGFELP